MYSRGPSPMGGYGKGMASMGGGYPTYPPAMSSMGEAAHRIASQPPSSDV